ncbi:MAG: alpha/beta hydrolase [Polaribacter sp.]|nr:alpha/beta hydrolase [Polaribacter sp.]
MSKTAIYFVPGMAANSKIYERIRLDKNRYTLHFLEWEIPLSRDESISDYAKRMCEKITHNNPVLVGVSFGGVLVQEMSKHITARKIVLISSIKSNQELPKRLKLVQITKVYKLFPARFLENLESHISYFLNDYQQKKADAYKKYMSVRNPDYLHWAIYNILHWQQQKPLNNTLHIHGTNDRVFPIKHIKDCIEIEGGTHIMILSKTSIISKILEENLTGL